MRHFIALLCLLTLYLPAYGQAVQLEVKGGDSRIVQVDRQVIVKVDVLTVSSFPFHVHAPAGGGLYFWQYPAGVTALDMGDKLEVRSAPQGEVTIGVKAISADWESKKFVTSFGQITVTVGAVPPGPGPGPKPEPVDPFVERLQSAYGSDTAPDKAQSKAALIALYRSSADAAILGAAKTWGALFNAMLKTADSLKLKGKLIILQQMLAEEMQAVLPNPEDAPAAPLDDAGRALAARTFTRIAEALEKVR